MSAIAEHAKGQWPEILAALGVDETLLTRRHGPCPGCAGADRFRFDDKDGRGTWICGQGGAPVSGDGFGLLEHVHGWDFARAAREVEQYLGVDTGKPAEPKPDALAWIRRELIQAPRSRYLEARGLEMPGCLRFAKRLAYFSDGEKIGEYPAMVAPVTRDGRLLTYHVTYLDGPQKAKVSAPRKLMGRARGGAVALYSPAKRLGIAEGIETAIAAKMLFDVPVWAALNTSLLQHWRPPAGVKTVVIYGDHDTNHAGHAAAYALSCRLRNLGIATEIAIPPKEGTDWNDMLLGTRAAA